MIKKGFSKYILGDLIEINKVSLKKDSALEDIEYIDTSSVTENRFSEKSIISVYKAPSRAKRIVRDKDIIYSTVRPIQRHYGYINNPNPNTVVSTGFAVLTSLKIDPKFLYYYLTQDEIINFLNGIAESNTTTFPAFNPSLFETLEITIPEDRSEQSRIASILSSLDDKIELNLQMNLTLEAIAQAIFKEWFVDFRFPGFDGELLDGLPKGWRKDTFINHVIAERGLSYKGHGLTVEGDGIPMNNLNSIYEGGGYKYEGIKHYNGEYKERHIARPGDIIVANTEQGHKYLLIGYPAVVPGYYGEITIFSHHIYRARPKTESNLTSQFIYYLLLQPNIRDQVIGYCNGTTVNMLKVDGLQRPVFILPPEKLIKKFSQLVQVIWQRKETNIIANRLLNNLRDTLLPKLMTGKIQVARTLDSNL